MEAFFLEVVSGRQRGLASSLVRGGLRLASIPYGLGARCRNWFFDKGWKQSHAAGVPVISVGNLTLGGTGKTPCVEYVARLLRGWDWRVAILSRGYGSQGGCNDEALLLKENLPDVPHLQGPDRVELARIAVEELESEVLVLDDGFQHRRLQRDLDLVLIDATAPWGHGYLFPRGLLREPLSGLRRAGVIVLTRSDQVGPERIEEIRTQVGRTAPDVPVVTTVFQPRVWVNSAGETLNMADIRQRPVAGFCGIGNPEAFRQTLTGLDSTPTLWRMFPDHHGYTRDDIDDLQAWARQLPSEGVVLTTQKDLVKIGLDRLGDRPLWALRIEMHIKTGENMLVEKLRNLLKK